MGAFEHQIEELVAFARDRDGNDRSVLFCELTDLYMLGKAPEDLSDRVQLLDVVEALVPHVTPNTRASVSAQLADMHHPPMDLVMRLIYDDADLITGLITRTPMDEDMLIEFIAKTGREHHQELATRNDLSANIWIALARAAPTMPMNSVHNQNALWDEDLGKGLKKKNISSPKNARELGIDLFMTRPTPQETVRVAAKKAPLKVVKSPKPAVINLQEEDIFEGKAANDLTKVSLSRKERRILDETVNHPLPHATIEVDDFNWDTHVNVDTGWALLTNRDGKIAELSQSAITFMGPASERLIAMDLIELIGLVDRPEHPVVRALSRHGAIHDAPVVLFVGPVGRASWTITALPKFDNISGLFEGFNCHFAPVPLTEEDIPVFLDEVSGDNMEIMPGKINSHSDSTITSLTGEVPIISESPLFIEDEDDIFDSFMADKGPSPLIDEPDITQALTEAVAQNMDLDVDVIRKQAQDLAQQKMAEIQSRLERQEIRDWPKIISQATESIDIEPDDESVDEDPLNRIFEPARTILKDVTADTLATGPRRQIPAAPKKPIIQTEKPSRSNDPMQGALNDLFETAKLAKSVLIAEEKKHSIHVHRMETIRHMLSMMEEAGARLKGKHPGDDPITIQLDADIAKTCARALRDLLNKCD